MGAISRNFSGTQSTSPVASQSSPVPAVQPDPRHLDSRDEPPAAPEDIPEWWNPLVYVVRRPTCHPDGRPVQPGEIVRQGNWDDTIAKAPLEDPDWFQKAAYEARHDLRRRANGSIGIPLRERTFYPNGQPYHRGPKMPLADQDTGAAGAPGMEPSPPWGEGATPRLRTVCAVPSDLERAQASSMK